jgi:hypothetical protein
VAAQTAVDAARGIEASAEQHNRRTAALLAERMAEQLRGAVTALHLLDRPSVPNATRRLIRAAALFAPAADTDRTDLLYAINEIEAALDQIRIADLPPAGSTARFASSGTLALTAGDDLNVIARLVEGGTRYAAAPDLDGAIPETGAWARSHPTAAHDTAAARVCARLDELAAMPRALRELVTGDDLPRSDATLVGYRLGENLGAAAAETARGRLYHLVELDRTDRVVRFDCLAPTEWNFHPRGPLARMLRGATLAADGHDAVDQLIAAFDPCVGTKLTIREAADA